MKSLLLVVDYQNDFVDGVLGFEKAKEIYPKIKSKILTYEENEDDVVFTKDTHHSEDYFETIEGKSLPIPHCIENTPGFDFYKDIQQISERHLVLKKNTFPCYRLYSSLKNNLYKSIEAVGVVTNICVLSNAIVLKSIFPNVPIIVDSACCASNDSKLEQEAFDILRNLMIEVK